MSSEEEFDRISKKWYIAILTITSIILSVCIIVLIVDKYTYHKKTKDPNYKGHIPFKPNQQFNLVVYSLICIGVIAAFSILTKNINLREKKRKQEFNEMIKKQESNRLARQKFLQSQKLQKLQKKK